MNALGSFSFDLAGTEASDLEAGAPASPNLGLLHAELERRRNAPAVDDAQPLSFHAADGRRLEGRLFTPSQASQGGILIGGATGVPQGFYSAYARWLAQQGWTVLSFDYRGIGKSLHGPLAEDQARMRDWGRLDLPAALEALAQRVPAGPLHLIGHSVGGQMIGLMPNHARLDRAVMLASGFGYWGNMGTAYGTLVRILVTVLGPLLYRLLGYAPNRAMGWGEDLPRGVAEDWFRWCRRPDYYAELLAEHRQTVFADVQLPLLSLRFSDDPIATAANVEAQLGVYRAAKITRQTVYPEAFGRRQIGHLHFFSSKMPESLWRLPLDWFTSPHRSPS